MEESRLGVSAWEIDRTIVRFPDPAIEVVDERFRSLIVWQEVVERLWTGGRWLEVRYGSATDDTCCSPTFRTTECSLGAKSPARSLFFVNRRTTVTGTRETGKGAS